jgi:hypothetical protein
VKGRGDARRGGGGIGVREVGGSVDEGGHGSIKDTVHRDGSD